MQSNAAKPAQVVERFRGIQLVQAQGRALRIQA
jgi:hypothetical protein